MSIEEDLVSYVSSVGYDDLPPQVIMATKKSIIDVLGVSIAGSGTPVVENISSAVSEWGGRPESAIFFSGTRVPAHHAVLVNSTMARSLDFDEYHMVLGTHPTPTVVPVALATAELCGGITGKEFLTAIATGAEVMCRLRLVPDYCSAFSGWAAEIHGVFAAAVTAGKLLGLSAGEMSNALGLAYSQAAGNTQCLKERGGGSTIALQQGFSARSGLMAAVLARRGLAAARNYLSGEAGLYAIYYRGIPCDTNRLLSGLGEEFEIMNLAAKPYPSCGYTIGPIGNVLELMRQHNLAKDDIAKVILRVNQAMYNSTCQPVETKYRPKIPADAIFSLPYAVGSAVLRGDVFLEDFTPQAIGDNNRLNEVDKVSTVVDKVVDEEAKRLNLHLYLHIAEIVTRGGESFSQKALYGEGSPQQPMGLEDCIKKAKRCTHFAAREFPESRMEELAGMIVNLEDVKDVKLLVQYLD